LALPAEPSAQLPLLQLHHVTKRHGALNALDDVSLSVGRGEFFALLGPSGCGKTTLLRLVAGFETPDAGRILIDGEDVTDMPAHRRPVNMMFQSYALFPHLNVEKNIAFGLVQDKLPKQEIAARVADGLRLVQLEGLGSRRPDRLSGGQRQRVALARALVKRPKLLLLDEPLAALDKRLREETGFELVHLQKTLGTTFLVVTHDQKEAMAMAGRIGVMRAGKIEQIGSASEIYERPASRHVAAFVGEINLLEGKVVGADPERHEVATAAGVIAVATGDRLEPGATIIVAVRPERIVLAPADLPGPDHYDFGSNRSKVMNMIDSKSVERDAGGKPVSTFPHPALGANSFPGRIAEKAYLGDLTLYRVAIAQGLVLHAAQPNAGQGSPTFEPGAAVVARFAPESCVVLRS
jgi:putrescine transport system ATP-binding protein